MEDSLQSMRMAARDDRVSDIVIITGMSGSGRTQALRVFEDMGYYCIDNLPPRLILDLARIVGINGGVGRHLAVTCDLRSQGLFDETLGAIQQLEEHELSVRMLFLDCSNEVLRRRYNETRRKHPISKPGEPLEESILRERKQLQAVRDHADFVIDTSRLHATNLRALIRAEFSELSDQQLMEVSVYSFGFKHGMPVEADLMLDARFLPNPFYDPEMRTLTGNDEKVASFVLGNEVTKRFLVAWHEMLSCALPGYIAEGKARLTIAIGCTGGQHRSVAIANATAAFLKEDGYRVVLSHRDLALANVSMS